MKKLLIVLGGLFVVLVVAVGAGIAYVALNGSALDRESKAYADTAIPAIIRTWNVDELEKRESPELHSTTNASDLDKLFQMFRKLGNLKAYNGVNGEANLSLDNTEWRPNHRQLCRFGRFRCWFRADRSRANQARGAVADSSTPRKFAGISRTALMPPLSMKTRLHFLA